MVTAFGDSKTAGDSWQDKLVASITSVCAWKLSEIAVPGAGSVYWTANLAGVLASYVGTPSFVLVNLGINDVAGSVEEATFKANFANILDQFNAKWPSAQVGVAHVWGRGYSVAALNGWIDDVLADGRAAWTFAGPDEPTWLEAGNDGATMTTDGVHYSAAGETENAAQWKTAMGY